MQEQKYLLVSRPQRERYGRRAGWQGSRLANCAGMQDAAPLQEQVVETQSQYLSLDPGRALASLDAAVLLPLHRPVVPRNAASCEKKHDMLVACMTL
jgi:hypothetical protein